MKLRYQFLDDYLKNNYRYPRATEAPSLTAAAIAAKRRARRKAPCDIIIWADTNYWSRADGQLVHVGRYQATKPRTTYVWWRPNETYPQGWNPHKRAICDAHRKGRSSQ